jgi:glucuronate isomerase
MNVDDAAIFNDYLGKLEAASNISITSFTNYLDALKNRHDFFATMGCAISDHGVEQIYSEDYTDAEIEASFIKYAPGIISR